MPEDERLLDLWSRLRALSAAPLLLVLLIPQPAAAQPPLLVATAPFDGRELPRPPKKPIEPGFTASVVYETLQQRSQGKPYRLLAPDLWTGMARVKHQGRTSDLAGMARLLGARLVIAGYLEATSGPEYAKPYRLNIGVHSADGAMVGQLAFDLDRPILQPASFAERVAPLLLLIEQSLLRPDLPTPAPPLPMAVSPPKRSGPVAQLEDSEEVRFDPSKPKTSLVPMSDAARDLIERRPPWQAAIDLQAGYVYSTRLLSNEGSELRFGRSGAHGLAVLGELYPLALLPSSGAWLSGLGLRAQVVLPFWSDIAHVLTPGQPQSGTYSATEYRYDLALRGHINPWNAVLRPDIAVEALYGEHVFQTAAKQNIDYLRVPPTDYRYVGGGLSARLFFTRSFQVSAGAMVAKHLSMGLMSRPGSDSGDLAAARDRNGFLSYGPGSGFQWRVEGATQLNVYRGVTVGARFFYEQNRLSFDGDGNVLTTAGRPVTSATDDYLGVMATIGYVFQPRLYQSESPAAAGQ